MFSQNYINYMEVEVSNCAKEKHLENLTFEQVLKFSEEIGQTNE